MANLTPQNLAVAKLYVALMNRAPDADGFAFWTQAYSSGASLLSLTQTVLGSPETLAIYPLAQTNEQFVTSFYSSVFGRAPDTGGLAFWSGSLAALGGAGSVSARAALVLQIADLVSTQLTSKPAGISDAAYALTVADRARFMNKVEFGVYFADELKGKDMALTKATLALITDSPLSVAAATKLALGIVDPVVPEVIPALTVADIASVIASKLAAYSGTSATVDATGMTPTQLLEVATGIGKIAVNGITGTLALTDGLTDTQLTALLGTKTNSTATVNVNAASMNALKLTALSDGVGKITSVNNLNLVLNDVLDAVTVNLLPKSLAASATVVATSGTQAELSALSLNIAKVSLGGITGTLNLSNTQTATELGNLLSDKTGEATATVTVDATSMDMTKLTKVGENIVRVDTLSNLPQLLLADLSNDATTGLLGAAAAGALTVVATGATADEVTSLAVNIGKIASNGITGTLNLTNALTAARITTLTDTQTALAANVVVDATGMDANQLIAVDGGNAKVDSITNMALKLTEITDDNVLGRLLGKSGTGTAKVDATSATSSQLVVLADNIAKIATDGITGTLALTSNRSATDIGKLLGTKTADGATVSVDAATMVAAQLDAVGLGIAKVDTLSNLPQLMLNALSDGGTSGLLGKAAAGTATVDATSATATEIDSLVSNLANVAAGGISGVLNLSTTQFGAANLTVLNAKLASAADPVNPRVTGPVLRIIGSAGNDTIDVSGFAGKIRVDGGAGADTITLNGSGGNLVYINSREETRNGVLGTDVDTTKIDTISGITNTDIIRLSLGQNVFSSNMNFDYSTTPWPGANSIASGVTANSINDIWAAANTLGPRTSNSHFAEYFIVQVTAGASGLTGKTFVILNDNANVAINGDDMMIALVGTTITPILQAGD